MLSCSTICYSGSSLDSHRLILFAGKQGLDKQHNLVEELMNGYFTQGKVIGDKDFLVESATKVGLQGAVEFLQDPNNGLQEECKCTLNVMKTRKKSTHIIVNEELGKYTANISGVPHYVINGKHQLSGGQPAEVFLRAFQVAAICRNGGLGGGVAD
ncbi:putative DSBA-like thioredoxin domain, Thioredoxin-like superfamily [Helianthus annuus]|nr:putative DSBA-like thioredoxin domain, Thioredoxin-like superfamily [Helianthus annuus]KAJ0659842.1 putative DSBA-like thioredoxin domain, Thioredoxin-like superfamily [Helianthus annuus]